MTASSSKTLIRYGTWIVPNCPILLTSINITDMVQIIRYIASNHTLGWGIVIGAAVLIVIALHKKLKKQY